MLRRAGQKLLTGFRSGDMLLAGNAKENKPKQVEKKTRKTDVYKRQDDETRALVEQGINPIAFPGLKLSVSSEESKACLLYTARCV